MVKDKKLLHSIIGLMMLPLSALNNVVLQPAIKFTWNEINNSFGKVRRYTFALFDLIIFSLGITVSIAIKSLNLSFHIPSIIISITRGKTMVLEMQQINDSLSNAFPIMYSTGASTSSLLVKYTINNLYDIFISPYEIAIHDLKYIYATILYTRETNVEKIVKLIKAVVMIFYNQLMLLFDYIDVYAIYINSVVILGIHEKQMQIDYYNKHLKNSKVIDISLAEYLASNGKAVKKIDGILTHKRLNMIQYLLANKKVIVSTKGLARILNSREHHREDDFLENIY